MDDKRKRKANNTEAHLQHHISANCVFFATGAATTADTLYTVHLRQLIESAVYRVIFRKIAWLSKISKKATPVENGRSEAGVHASVSKSVAVKIGIHFPFQGQPCQQS